MLICIALVPRLNIEAMLCLTYTHPPPHERDDPYLYGQTRALPLDYVFGQNVTTCNTSPSTILANNSAPSCLIHQIFTLESARARN